MTKTTNSKSSLKMNGYCVKCDAAVEAELVSTSYEWGTNGTKIIHILKCPVCNNDDIQVVIEN